MTIVLRPRIGSYVTHAKLLQLGSGEVCGWDDHIVTIRFASGERNFVFDLVAKHLVETSEAPVVQKKSAKRARTTRA